jgi:hypothetical protein
MIGSISLGRDLSNGGDASEEGFKCTVASWDSRHLLSFWRTALSVRLGGVEQDGVDHDLFSVMLRIVTLMASPSSPVRRVSIEHLNGGAGHGVDVEERLMAALGHGGESARPRLYKPGTMIGSALVFSLLAKGLRGGYPLLLAASGAATITRIK